MGSLSKEDMEGIAHMAVVRLLKDLKDECERQPIPLAHIVGVIREVLKNYEETK